MRNYNISEIENLRKLDCINKMGESYINRWISLVERYAPRLNDAPILKQVAFTNHDFSHHCKDIYVLINSVLLKDTSLMQEEFFVLAVAVLMHDISMTVENFDRLCHSRQSADYIQKEIEQGEDVWQNVPVQHIPIIKKIVEAHSDIKEINEGNLQIVKHTLQETDEMMTGEFGDKIHVRWLAGVLRLADELDITNARMKNGENRYTNLDSEDNSQHESQLCWEQLNYFKEVRMRKANIQLVVNEQYLKTHLDDDRGNIVKQIINIHKKIADCIDEVNECVFDACEDYIIRIRRAVISDDTKIFTEDELGKILEKSTSKKAADGEELQIGFDRDKAVVEEVEEISIGNMEADIESIEGRLEEKITKFILSHGLIQHGHYRLNRRFCSTDWIDVRAILSHHELGNEIVDLFVKDMENVITNNSGDVLAVGISMNGNILASQVAFKMGIPFTYLVPFKPGMEGSEMEREFKLEEAKKVVLFTGVISSYDTITSTIREYLEGVEVVKIYTVLLRSIKNEYSLDEKKEQIREEIRNKIVYLNRDFDCETLSKDKCLNAKYGDCIAQNKHAYDEVYQWSLAVKDETNKRVFVNNIIGCDNNCSYCYLKNIGIWKKETYSADEVIAEFERIHDVNPEEYIISIGCYSESMQEDNISNVLRMVQYFAEEKYYIQISTKSHIKKEWIEEMEQFLVFPNQLNIYISMSTIKQADKYEKNAVTVQERISNFEYKSPNNKVCIYMYIKPYLTGITDKDSDEFLELVEKYGMKVVVGNGFDLDTLEGTPVRVGKNEMYEAENDDIDEFILRLQNKARVYRHSIEPIKEEMAKNKSTF